MTSDELRRVKLELFATHETIEEVMEMAKQMYPGDAHAMALVMITWNTTLEIIAKSIDAKEEPLNV